MASFTGTKVKDTYPAILKTTDNAALSGSLKVITDGLGNNSALSLSTAGASVGGTLAVSGNLTVDTNTLFVDASSDSVSINDNVTANVPLTVTTNSGYEDVLYLKSSGTNIDSRISMFPTGTGNAVINAGTNSLEFQIGGSEKVRVDSSGDISFRDSSANEAFYWDASAASLGIGTPSPSAPIEIVGPDRNQIKLGNGSNIFYQIGRNTATGAFHFYGNQSGDVAYIFEGVDGEKMRIDSSGRVGIGGSPDNAKLEVFGKTIVGSNSSNALEIHSNGDTEIAFSYSTKGNNYAKIIGDITNASPLGGEIAFQTASGGTLTERMRITSGGYLKASNSGSYAGASDSFHELRTSNGDWTAYISSSNASPYGTYFYFSDASPNNTSNIALQFADSSAVRFRVYSNGNVVNTNNSYGAISDIKVKENITDATPKLDKLMDVRVVNYNLIGDDKKQLGVVAQELEQVFPSMIDESPDYEEVEVPQLDENGQEVLDENGEVVMTKERVDLGTVTKSVKYSVFVPMLIKAIQELNAKVESLEAQLNA